MKNFALGRYIPIDSLMHQMDPRAKIAAMLMMMVAIFIPAGFLGYVVLGAAILLAVSISNLNLILSGVP